MSVYPAADVPLRVSASGNPYVIVNQGPTDHDAVATLIVSGLAGTVLPALVAAISAQPAARQAGAN